jgi:hypothetical protein
LRLTTPVQILKKQQFQQALSQAHPQKQPNITTKFNHGWHL